MLACDYSFTRCDVDPVSPHVRVRGRDGAAIELMLNDDQPTPVRTELGNSHNSVCGSKNGGAVGCCEIEAVQREGCRCCNRQTTTLR